MKAIANRLQSALSTLKKSQAEVAKAAKVSPALINDVLANVNAAKEGRIVRTLSASNLRALATARDLRISADYLLGVPGATMIVGETFEGSIEEALAAHVRALLATSAEGKEWAGIIGQVTADGGALAIYLRNHLLADIDAAWNGKAASVRMLERFAALPEVTLDDTNRAVLPMVAEDAFWNDLETRTAGALRASEGTDSTERK